MPVLLAVSQSWTSSSAQVSTTRLVTLEAGSLEREMEPGTLRVVGFMMAYGYAAREDILTPILTTAQRSDISVKVTFIHPT